MHGTYQLQTYKRTHQNPPESTNLSLRRSLLLRARLAEYYYYCWRSDWLNLLG